MVLFYALGIIIDSELKFIIDFQKSVDSHLKDYCTLYVAKSPEDAIKFKIKKELNNYILVKEMPASVHIVEVSTSEDGNQYIYKLV